MRLVPQNRTVRDLLALTLVKIGVIALIYYACFAAYDGRPVDTIAHLLGPAAAPPQAGQTQGF
jgi:hypothetical protein